jgi:DNA-binding NtrC family response regulator
MKKHCILIADDDKNIQFAFRQIFERDGFEVLTAENGREALDLLEEGNEPMMIFMDVTMPEMTGLEALQRIRDLGLEIPVVIITGFGTMQTAVKAVQLGAYEYITKPLDIDKIRVVVKRALEMVNLRNEVKDLRAKLITPSGQDEIIGNHLKIQEVFKTIGAVTATPNTTNVLIFGESGTGKELVARAIHNMGPTNGQPFVAINCTVLPETLLESELFGHERGAFTGASQQKKGKFEVAANGTLFLDEIGDMSVNLQQKLLRVLQEREFERLGGNTLIPVHARFIAATHKDLEEAIKEGTFRQDLYFRLNVISIKLPPLHERRDDIPLLADHFLTKCAAKLGKSLKGISNEVVKKLMEHNYPGNVRELENIIEHSVAMVKGDILTVASLPADLHSSGESEPANFEYSDLSLQEARRKVLEAFEKQYISELLQAAGGNVSAAARKANIERQSLQRLMKKYLIQSKDFR